MNQGYGANVFSPTIPFRNSVMKCSNAMLINILMIFFLFTIPGHLFDGNKFKRQKESRGKWIGSGYGTELRHLTIRSNLTEIIFFLSSSWLSPPFIYLSIYLFLDSCLAANIIDWSQTDFWSKAKTFSLLVWAKMREKKRIFV